MGRVRIVGLRKESVEPAPSWMGSVELGSGSELNSRLPSRMVMGPWILVGGVGEFEGSETELVMPLLAVTMPEISVLLLSELR